MIILSTVMSVILSISMRWQLLGRTCRGICQMHEAKPMPNGLRYESGQKRCTFCGLFFLIDDVRCPCCKVVLRTNPRSRHKNQKR